MSFIATAPPSAHHSDSKAPLIIKNNGWFPDVDIPQMRNAMRLDGTVTDPRLVQAVVISILHVNGELKEWQAEQAIAGYTTMGDVPGDKINGESRFFIQYRRAVYSTAKADLLERYRDYDTTASTLSDQKAVESLTNAPAEQRRNAQWAIADICGRTHLTIELI